MAKDKEFTHLNTVEVMVNTGPFVKLQTESDTAILFGNIRPAQAREIAVLLLVAAVRAELTSDLHHKMEISGLSEEQIAAVFTNMELFEKSWRIES